MRLLVVAAVAAERDAVLARLDRADGLDVDKEVDGGLRRRGRAARGGGHGERTGRERATGPCSPVGIGGGFASAAAPGRGGRRPDRRRRPGRRTPVGLPVRWTSSASGSCTYTADADLVARGRGRCAGPAAGRRRRSLTVSTVTGTADRAAELAAGHPDAAAEGDGGLRGRRGGRRHGCRCWRSARSPTRSARATGSLAYRRGAGTRARRARYRPVATRS